MGGLVLGESRDCTGSPWGPLPGRRVGPSSQDFSLWTGEGASVSLMHPPPPNPESQFSGF